VVFWLRFSFAEDVKRKLIEETERSGTFFGDNIQHKTREYPPKNEPDPGL